MSKITRRQVLGGAAVAATGIVLTGCGPAAAKKPETSTETPKVPKLENKDFYKDGVFLVEKATQAYKDMFKRFNYPFPEAAEKLFWTNDFGLEDFVNCGMGGIFWWNSEKYQYFGHEIYLLPGQMIPEHKHLPTEKGPAKAEAWHVRYGKVFTFAEGGEPNAEMMKMIPESQRDTVHVNGALPLGPGELRELDPVESWHFMMAGPEGAIVTEYANYHDGDGLRFGHPKGSFTASGHKEA